LKPWKFEDVSEGTSFKIIVTGAGPITICAISEIPGAGAKDVNKDCSGGWSNNVTGLVAKGFTQSFPSLYYNEDKIATDANYTMNIFCRQI
jgi:hypothetical protein